MPTDKPIRVAIIGGGCGAMSAAFELTRPEQQGRFEVTVYQQGWRLGGKGASGRGPFGRIEEHALHVWLGFYENAFRMLRECHAELGTPDAWRDEFVEDSFIALSREGAPQSGPDSKASAWAALFPPTPGLPGDPLVRDSNPFAVASYMRQAMRLLQTLMGGLAFLEHDSEQGFTDKAFSALGPYLDAMTPGQDAKRQGMVESLRQGFDEALNVWKGAFFGSMAGFLAATNTIERLIVGAAEDAAKERATEAALDQAEGRSAAPMAEEGGKYLVVELVEAFADAVRKQLSPMVHGDPRISLRWQIMDLVLAVMVGTMREGLFARSQGLDAINHYECRDWLRKYGAAPESINGPFVNGLYFLGFANKAGVAAGQALRGALRMFFTYRGAMFWKMRAGMGDVVFTPLYQLLQKRKVKFEFFHRLENVGMTFPGGTEVPYVSSLEFDVQGRTKKGAEYEPLIDVKGRRCWPSEPQWDQLDPDTPRDCAFESFFDRRKVATKTLRVVEDFDFVVLGVSKGAIQYVCRELWQHDGKVGMRWKAMVENVKTVATQAFQVWLRTDLAGLGWHEDSVTVTGMQGHFDTWADMRQVIPSENWPKGQEPGTVAYFCGPLGEPCGLCPEDAPGSGAHDSAPVLARLQEVQANARQFLETRAVRLWDNAGTENAFRWELLADSNPGARVFTDGDAAMPAQYVTANVNPSDRYVLATAGSIEHRISPLETGIDNMTIAGDWTACGFTEGCVEAAVMSGRLASHAISQRPKLEDIVGYDHP